MYKNVIFDLGGVIVKFNPKNFLMEKFLNEKKERLIYDIVFGSETWLELDRGAITRSDANLAMLEKAKEKNCAFEVQEVLDTWQTILKPRERVIEVAKKVKDEGYDIYYLSNMSEDVFENLSKQDFFPNFDGGICSYEVKINKPDDGIFNALLEKYSLDADDCIFIDDSLVNVKAACDLNLTGIHMRGGVNGLLKRLKVCGITLNAQK